jgi:hypothetical protein
MATCGKHFLFDSSCGACNHEDTLSRHDKLRRQDADERAREAKRDSDFRHSQAQKENHKRFIQAQTTQQAQHEAQQASRALAQEELLAQQKEAADKLSREQAARAKVLLQAQREQVEAAKQAEELAREALVVARAQEVLAKAQAAYQLRLTDFNAMPSTQTVWDLSLAHQQVRALAEGVQWTHDLPKELVVMAQRAKDSESIHVADSSRRAQVMGYAGDLPVVMARDEQLAADLRARRDRNRVEVEQFCASEKFQSRYTEFVTAERQETQRKNDAWNAELQARFDERVASRPKSIDARLQEMDEQEKLVRQHRIERSKQIRASLRPLRWKVRNPLMVAVVANWLWVAPLMSSDVLRHQRVLVTVLAVLAWLFVSAPLRFAHLPKGAELIDNARSGCVTLGVLFTYWLVVAPQLGASWWAHVVVSLIVVIFFRLPPQANRG